MAGGFLHITIKALPSFCARIGMQPRVPEAKNPFNGRIERKVNYKLEKSNLGTYKEHP